MIETKPVLEEITTLKGENERLKQDNDDLRELVRFLQTRIYGSKSEKGESIVQDDQLKLFVLDEDDEGQETDGDDHGNQGDNSEPRSSQRHPAKNLGRKPLPKHLPRVDVVVDLDPEEKQCCGREMKQFGQDQREMLSLIPAILYVKRLIIPKYSCSICKGDHNCHGAVATADTPSRILPGSHADNSLAAEVIANKIVDGLPAYRQNKRFQRLGFGISPRTMTNWMLRVAKKCEILGDVLRKEIVDSPAIQMDETTVQVMDEEGRSNQTKSYMWVMRGVPPNRRLIYYLYHPTRAAQVPKTLLQSYQGVIQTDGYKGYDFLATMDGVRLIACWAHVRRKFHDVVKASGKRKKTTKKSFAEQALAMIRQLYAIERRATKTGLTEMEIATLRKAEAKPLLLKLKTWLDEHAPKVPQSSLTGKAIHYCLRLWQRLTYYAETGHLPIDNNGVENVIRPFVIGRKNFLFAGSPKGAKAIATLYSLVETAKANDWDPYVYLRFLFDNLPNAIGETELLKLLPHKAQPVPASFYVDRDRQVLDSFLVNELATA